eukprot:Amastigsp_a677407_86.p2 type:complete len:160 gc:universal Amastigsp_a677407_86:346-825(+)
MPVRDGVVVRPVVIVRDGRRVLNADELVGFAVPKAEDKIARPVRVRDACLCVGDRVVVLEQIAEQIRERNSKPRLFAKSRVGKRNADLARARRHGRHARERADERGKANVRKRVPVVRVRVVHRDLRKVLERPVDVPVESTELKKTQAGSNSAAVGTEH